jgi:dihydropteroate synthase
MKNEAVFRVRGTLHRLGGRTWIMGIVNVTPDSFYDGGRFADPGRAVDHALELAAEGADILDVGGESSRPGSDPVPIEEELRRVVPVIAGLRRRTSVLISVDTTKPEVAEVALDAGADIVNDISAAGLDHRMLGLAARHDAGFVLMHMKGSPKTMQEKPHYDDVIGEIRAFFAARMETARTYGLATENIVLDPGIGFGKQLEDNLTLINGLHAFADVGRPLLVGASRKAFLGKILDAPSAEDRLEGSIAVAVMAVVRGAHILRVHDVRAVRRAALVAEAILGAPPRARAAGAEATAENEGGGEADRVR